jgi:hypothetical protein
MTLTNKGLNDPRTAPNIWRSICSIFPRGKRRGMQAQLRLTQAYQAVFFGNPAREDQAIVLAHMLNTSGFQKVTVARGSSDQEIWQAEGKRSLYAETIFANLSLPDAEMRALENAARMEAAVDQDEAERK